MTNFIAVKQRDLFILVDKENNLIPNTKKFKDFVIGVGWLDRKGKDHYANHWYAVVGKQEDDCYLVISEGSGDLLTITKQMINWKDRLFIERIFVEEEPQYRELIRKLRPNEDHDYDGLSHYGHDGMNHYRRILYWHKPEFWPYFRGREHVASIIGVPTELKADILGGYELLRQLIQQERFIVRLECKQTGWLFGPQQHPPYDSLLKHPLLKALIWAIGILEREKNIRESVKRSIAYKNLKRL